MKILIISHNYDLNGATRMLQEAVSFFASNLHHDVYVLILDSSQNSNEQIWSSIGAQVIYDPLDFKLYDWVIVNGIISIDIIKFIKPHVPTILWIHEGSTILYNTHLQVREYIYYFESFDKIIFQSNYQNEIIFRSFTQCIPLNKISIIPSFVHSINHNDTFIKKGNIFTIICIGNVCVRKGQLLLAAAVKELSLKCKIECIFIGDTEQAPAEWKKIIDNEICLNDSPVKWLGKITDRNLLMNYLRNSDLACLPSNDESDPIFPLEAASVGIPTLLNDLPVYESIGWKHNFNCFKFNINDNNSMIESLNFCMSNIENLRKVGLSAKEFVNTNRCVENFHQSIADIIA